MCNTETKYQELAEVLSISQEAVGSYCMELQAPQICAAARPGQFVHVKVENNPVQLLRMPFCVYDVHPQTGSIDICFQVLGEGTEQLSGLRVGDLVSVVGPVGNGWSIPENAQAALLICGGLGAAPLNMLARQLSSAGVRVDIALGSASSDRIVCRDRLEASAQASGGKLLVSTDDGTEGVHGFCTQISDELLDQADYDCVFVCGPGPMERNACRKPLEMGIACQVSFEKLMACGIGACLSCIVETVNGRKRCCVDGPVFNASEVIW